MMNDNDGQSTIEFLITIVFAIGILFLFIGLALNATNGFLVHWAVYKTSRTYMVMDNSSSQNYYQHAENTAKEVFNSIIRNTNTTFIRNGKLDFNDQFVRASERKNKVFIGPFFEFRQKFSLFPLVGGNSMLNLVSESFLGREVARAECWNRLRGIMTNKLGVNCRSYKHCTLFDNGC